MPRPKSLRPLRPHYSLWTAAEIVAACEDVITRFGPDATVRIPLTHHTTGGYQAFRYVIRSGPRGTITANRPDRVIAKFPAAELLTAVRAWVERKGAHPPDAPGRA